MELLDDLSAFSYKLQNGKTLDQLFFKAEERQEKLICLAIDVIIILTFFHCDAKYKLNFFKKKSSNINLEQIKIKDIIDLMKNEIIVSSKDFCDKNNKQESNSSKIALEKANLLCTNFFQIISNGIKTKKRAKEKILSRFNGNPIFIKDIVRITIIPKYPEFSTEIGNCLTQLGYDVCMKHNWRIRSSGVLEHSCHINLDGFVAQIHIDNEFQMIANQKFTHKIYETARLMTGIDHKFTTKIDFNNIQTIKDSYNEIMRDYKDINPNFIISTPKENIDDFNDSNLFNRFKELMLLHQSIHIDAICHTNEKWQELYCKLIIEVNDKSINDTGKMVFPKELINRIPNYKLYEKNYSKIIEKNN